jgi:hypothetical protein
MPAYSMSRCQTTASLTIPTIQRLSFDKDFLTLPRPETGDFDQGYQEVKDILTMTISSNTPWALTIKTDSTKLGELGGKDKPAEHLLWKPSQADDFMPLTSSAAPVASSRLRTAGESVSIDLKLLLDWVDDSPGEISSTLLFTFGAPS